MIRREISVDLVARIAIDVEMWILVLNVRNRLNPMESAAASAPLGSSGAGTLVKAA